MTTTADRQTVTSNYFRVDDHFTPDEIAIRDKVRAFGTDWPGPWLGLGGNAREAGGKMPSTALLL